MLEQTLEIIFQVNTTLDTMKKNLVNLSHSRIQGCLRKFKTLDLLTNKNSFIFITNLSLNNFTVIWKLFTCIWYISIRSASHLFPYLNEKLGWNIKSSYKSSWECSSSLMTEQIKSKAVCKLWTGLNLKLLVKSYFPICSLCFALHSIHLMDTGYKFSLQYFLTYRKFFLIHIF